MEVLIDALDDVRVAVDVRDLGLQTQPLRERVEAFEVLGLVDRRLPPGLHRILHGVDPREVLHHELGVRTEGDRVVEVAQKLVVALQSGCRHAQAHSGHGTTYNQARAVPQDKVGDSLHQAARCRPGRGDPQGQQHQERRQHRDRVDERRGDARHCHVRQMPVRRGLCEVEAGKADNRGQAREQHRSKVDPKRLCHCLCPRRATLQFSAKREKQVDPVGHRQGEHHRRCGRGWRCQRVAQPARHAHGHRRTHRDDQDDDAGRHHAAQQQRQHDDHDDVHRRDDHLHVLDRHLHERVVHQRHPGDTNLQPGMLPFELSGESPSRLGGLRNLDRRLPRQAKRHVDPGRRAVRRQ